jgi:hypothetical protein
MKISSTKAVAAAAIIALALTTLSACSPGGTSAITPKSEGDREAAAYRASRLCVLNGTDKTILSVGEFEMSRKGETHPDPAGPLEPGATWCTNGYNSFTDSDGDTQDANVEIKYSDFGGDFTRFAVSNPGGGYPTMVYGQRTFNTGYFQPGYMGLPWEADDTVPDSNTANPETGPSHDYHLRRLDDTPLFKEWLITVRR